MFFLDFLQRVLSALPGAVSQGVLWGVMTLGVYLTFRILNVADMTVDGSFAAGGAITAILIVKGMNPYLTLLFVFIVGMLCGAVTGFMNTKLKIDILLASILTQIALYSINIRIMGKANTPMLGLDTMMTLCVMGVAKIGALFKGVKDPDAFEDLYDTVSEFFTTTTSSLIIGLIVVAVVIIALYWFLGTEFGSAIRATGSNPNMVRALGVNTDTTKIIGLMLGNGLVALSGALVAQSQGYADVGMGTGTIVVGLASIIIGEVVFGVRFGLWWTLLSVIFGSIIYRIVIAIVLEMGLKSTDLKLLTALVVAIALSVPVFKNKIDKRRKAYKGPNNEEDTSHDNSDLKKSVETISDSVAADAKE